MWFRFPYFYHFVGGGGVMYGGCSCFVILRACLKIHSRHLHAPLCDIFAPRSVNAAHYASLIRVKSAANCDAQLTESNFQTRYKKNRKTGILFTISYPKNVAIDEINTINKNCPAVPTGNFKAKKPATTRIGIWRM